MSVACAARSPRVVWLVCAWLWAAGGGCDGCGDGCGANDEAGSATGQVDASPPALEPLVPRAMGLPSLSGFAYSRGDGRPAFKRAIDAESAFDWPAVEAACRDALAADPGHLEAHWHLALALARQRRFADVAAPLSEAVAGDWMRWGERSLKARALARFRTTPFGAQWAAVVPRYREQFRAAVERSLLVIGRRGRPWYPRRAGEQPINHRSELYGYDFDTGRYLRLSRTNGSFVGYLRAPDRDALIYASYRKVVGPAPAVKPSRPRGGRPSARSGTPSVDVRDTYIRELRIGALDLDRLAMSRREVAIDDVMWAEIGYSDGDGAGEAPALVARVRGATGDERVVRIDVARGRASPADGPGPTGDVLRVEYDLVRRFGTPVAGVVADWDDRGAAGAFRLESTRRTVALPGGQTASGHSMRWSPSRERLAFATVADEPCSDDPAERGVKLYVVDAATGVLRAVASGEGDLAPLWVDDARVAYVDNTTPRPTVRVVDAVTGQETAHLEARGAVNTDRLVSTLACRLPPVAPEDREYDVEDLSLEE